MSLKKNHVLALLGCSLVVVFFLVLFFTQQSTKNRFSSGSDQFLYLDFQKKHPLFESEVTRLTHSGEYRDLALSAESMVPQATERFEKTYLQYIAAYSYVSAVIQDNNDADSLEKAISITREIVSDENSYPIIKAHALDSYDRLVFTFMEPSVREKAMNDSYFQKFALPNPPTDRQAFRKNLLLYATSLYPVTNAYYKLAMLEIQTSELQQVFRPITDSAITSITNEQIRMNFFSLMNQGDEFLKRDYNKQGLFQNTTAVPEALLSRTIAAQIYFLATRETPFGDISMLYKKALEEAVKLNPAYSRVIKYWEADWIQNAENYKNLY